MIENLTGWIIELLASSGILVIVGFVFRGPIMAYFARSLEFRYEKRLEDTKASIRANEAELQSIRSFLSDRQNQRQSVLELKRLEAAESLMEFTNAIAALNFFVELMKMLKLDEVNSSSDNKDLADFFKNLVDTLKLDAALERFNAYDRSKARLYLSEQTLTHFDIFTAIVSRAALFVKTVSLGLDHKMVLSEGALSKRISEAAPNSTEGFEEYGEGYAFYWSQHFYDQLVRALRLEVSGADGEQEDAATIVRLTASSIQARNEARRMIASSNLPHGFLRDPTDLPPDII